MKTRDVFTPGSYPTVTFVDDHMKDKQRVLSDALHTGSLVISIAGPSKSGKTVMVENLVGGDHLLHVTGAGIDSAKKLWERVFEIIGTPIGNTVTTEKAFQGSLMGTVGAEVGLLAKGKGEVGAKGKWSSGTSKEEEMPIDHLQLLIKELAGAGYVVFIDDFHYIDKLVQSEIAQQIKEAIRHNIPIICASVPYHSDDVIRANADLRGRITAVDCDYWKPDNLAKIANKGFAALNIDCQGPSIEHMAHEAAGSPQLMQSMCLNACYEAKIYESSETRFAMPVDPTFWRAVFKRTALTADYSSIVNKMKDGPKTRGTDRNKYTLKTGAQCDVYPLILRAISQDPPQLTFRYAGLAERIEKICHKDLPSGSSVTGACLHASAIANDAANQVIVEWDPQNDVLDLRDPYLLFYLRWAEYSDG